MSSTEIKIQVITAKPISFAVNSELKYEQKLALDDLELSLETEFRVDNQHQIVGLAITFYTSYEHQELFKLNSFFEFKIQSMEDVVKEKDSQPDLEPDFARKLLNIGIGGTRGMLSIYLSNTQYDWFTMPIANLPDSLLMSSKK